MIDVIAPPEFFNFELMEDFTLATDPSVWLPSIVGPHLPKHLPNCGPRTFVRFMIHRISPKARLANLVSVDGLMFVGTWNMATGNDFRKAKPKVYTDLASGNDLAINKYVIGNLLVDLHNSYITFNNSLDDVKRHWIIETSIISPYTRGASIDMRSTGKYYDEKKFIMDQYSCMEESSWLEFFVNKRWCFYKMMEAGTVEELTGSFSWGAFSADRLSFPSGSVEDCSKPLIRAVYAHDLHWVRDTYVC